MPNDIQPDAEENAFRSDLKRVINRHSRENGSNTPDHVLADYLLASLAAFDAATSARESWYGVEMTPGGVSW